MAKTSTRTTVFDTTPETLIEVLTDAKFQEEQRKLDEAVVESTFVETSRTDTRLTFELRSTEYERGIKGLNKKKTIKTKTAVDWDLKAARSKWVYTTPMDARFSLSGSQRVEAQGGKVRFVSEFTVEMKVPLIGKKIEGMIVNGMEKGSGGHDALVRKYLAKK